MKSKNDEKSVEIEDEDDHDDLSYDGITDSYALNDEYDQLIGDDPKLKGKGNTTYVKAKTKTAKGEGSKDVALSRKHLAFCDMVARGFSASKAYLMAFKGCATSTANSAGPRLLKNEAIMNHIDKLKKSRALVTLEVSPQESMERWNELYQAAKAISDYKTMIEVQKQIDKINGVVDGATKGKDEGSIFIQEGDDLDEVLPKLISIIGIEREEAKKIANQLLNQNPPPEPNSDVQDSLEDEEE